MRNGPRSRKRCGYGMPRGRRGEACAGVVPRELTEIANGRERELTSPLLRLVEDRLRSSPERKALPESGRRHDLVAVIDSGKCTVCGRCAGVCPVGAITVDSIVNIDAGKCLDCGRCASECPQGAITIKRV